MSPKTARWQPSLLSSQASRVRALCFLTNRLLNYRPLDPVWMAAMQPAYVNADRFSSQGNREFHCG
jgi:hypothetical protein